MRKLIILIVVVVIGYGIFSNFNYFSTLSLQDLSERQAELSEKSLSKYFNYSKIIGRHNGQVVEEVYICFGDVCPDNGGYFLRYKNIDSEEECLDAGGDPIIGVSFGLVYGGCGIKFE